MASVFVTKEIESRIKQSPEHVFEVFLEIHEPINNEAPEILIKYPNDFSDQILKTAASFAYPCQIPSDDQSENFTFVVLDSTGLTFRFGYCRRSNRESTCLCIISYYPWFEMFYNTLNDLSQIINTKSTTELERFLSLLYNYKLLSIEEFYKNDGKEVIKITDLSKDYIYSRPDQRKLPSMLSNLNFTVMYSRLSSDIMLRLFAHLIFERRILFISSKLFHLTACVCGCLHLINPMHWQSIFLPILPESMTWTTQCTAPYIIGIHSSIYSRMNKNELGDVVIVNIDDRTIESQYDDLNLFPKHLIRRMKKDIQQSSQLTGDHLARVFLRTMAFIIGNYSTGFVINNEKLDFDRDVYLKQYIGSDLYKFMSSVVNTQMFEQFSRYRTFVQLEPEIGIDEFEIEVKNLEQIEQSKKPKNNKKFYKILEKATNPLIEQVQNTAEKLQTVINKTGQKAAGDSSLIAQNLTSVNHQTVPQSNSSDLLNEKSSPEPNRYTTDLLIDFHTDENPLLPSPIVLNMVETSSTSENPRPIPQTDSKIKQLQNELRSKIQTFDNKRIDPRDEYGEQQKEIRKLVQQFDPLENSDSVTFRSDLNISNRHPSIFEVIPTNYVNNVLKNIHTNNGIHLKQVYSSTSTNHLYPQLPSTETNESNLIDFN